MAIEFRCDNCKARQTVPDYSAGKEFKCQCGRLLTVPGGKTPVNSWTIVMIVVALVTIPLLIYLLTMESEAPPPPVDDKSTKTEEEEKSSETATEETEEESKDSTKEAATPHVPLPLSALTDTIAPQGDAPSKEDTAAQAQFRAGDRAYANGNYEDALAAYREVLAINGKNRVARRRVAAALYNSEEYDEAIRELDDLIAEDREDAESQYLRGCILRRLGDQVSARAQLRVAIELSPAHFPAREELAFVLREMGDEQAAIDQFYEAIARCRQLLAKAPNDASLHVVLGKMLAEVGNYEEAEKCLKTASQLGLQAEDVLKQVRARRDAESKREAPEETAPKKE